MTEPLIERARTWLRICHCNEQLPVHGYIVIEENESGPFFSKEVGMAALLALRTIGVLSEEEAGIILEQIDNSQLTDELNLFDELTAIAIGSMESEFPDELDGEIYFIEIPQLPTPPPNCKAEKPN